MIKVAHFQLHLQKIAHRSKKCKHLQNCCNLRGTAKIANLRQNVKITESNFLQGIATTKGHNNQYVVNNQSLTTETQFLTRVNMFVFCKSTMLTKCPATSFTHKWSFTRVNTSMSAKILI